MEVTVSKKRFVRSPSKNERRSSITILAALLAGLIWFAAQKSNYIPTDRELANTSIHSSSASKKLYHAPIQLLQQTRSEPDPLHPFSKNLLQDGWKGRVKFFNAANLFQKINGEADKFLKRGFKQLSYLLLTSPGGQNIAVELFDQGSAKGSLSIFVTHGSQTKKILTQGRVIYFRTRLGAIGRVGAYFFRIAADESTPVLLKKAGEIVQSFASLKESQTDQDPLWNLLTEKLKIPEKDLDFKKSGAFQFDFTRDFWFARLPEGRLFIHLAKDVESANQLFSQLITEQSYEFDPIQKEKNQVQFLNPFLKTRFVVALQGKWIFGVYRYKGEQGWKKTISQIKESLP